MKLHFSEPGYLYDGINISNGDVKCALLRVDEALFDTDVPRESLFSQEIITTESGNKIELAHILIGREEVKHRYLEMGFDTFPWVTTPLPNSESDYIERPTISVNKMEEKLKLKQNLPKEPNRLNQIYKPDRGIIKQKNWDLISDANKTTWKHRDTLTIFEFAFILKGKEPQSKATQRNVTELYPIEFCNFFRELEASSDSSLKMHTLTEINPPTLYSEEWAGTPEFERKQLINWAVSKEFDVPGWLINQPKNKSSSGNNPRKKLKPLIRGTNEVLLLIYDFCAKYDVNYLDEMPASKVWGLLVSNKFSSSYIKHLPETKAGSITFNGGEKINTSQFGEKYRSRFEIE